MVKCEEYIEKIYWSVINVEKRRKEWSEAVDYYSKMPAEKLTEKDIKEIREVIDIKRRFWDEARDAYKEKLNGFIKCEVR